MDTASLPSSGKTERVSMQHSAADALAQYAQDWPEHAARLIGATDVGDGATFRRDLYNFLDHLLRSQVTGEALASTTSAMRAILDHESADQFKFAVAADARQATRERFEDGVVRSVWGVTPIINLGTMRQSARRLGVDAESFCYQPYHVTSAFDVVLTQQFEWALKTDAIAYSWLTFSWALLSYDIFHTYYDRGFLLPFGGYGSPNYGVNEEEMRFLRIAGKRFYCMSYGADNRTRKRTLESGPINFCMHCTAPGRYCICDDDAAEEMFAVIDQYTTANLASGLSTDYIPNAIELHYLVVDTDRFEPTPLEPDAGRPLRVLHAPNHPHFKGSHYLMDAVDALRREGVNIELNLVTGVAQTQVMKAMQESDIIVDQLIGGFYGQTAIEAMAMGRPVMCFISDPSRAAAPDELPIINCDPDTVEDTLRKYATDRTSLKSIGVRSRAYVERHHSLDALAHRLHALYRETAELPNTVTLTDPRDGRDRPAELKVLNPTGTQVMRRARSKMRDGLADLSGGVLETMRAANGRTWDRLTELEKAAKEASREAEQVRTESTQRITEAEAALFDALNAANAAECLAEQIKAEAAQQTEASRLRYDLAQANLQRLSQAAALATRSARDAEQRAQIMEEHAHNAHLRAEELARQAAAREGAAARAEQAARETQRLAQVQHAAAQFAEEETKGRIERVEEALTKVRRQVATERKMRAAALVELGLTENTLEKERVAARSRLEELQRERAAESDRARKVAARLREMQSSKAWRLTRPLRQLNAWLRGVRRPTPHAKAAPAQLAADATAFIDDFKSRYNRPLRVLHIGNTANNAFNNARIQRQYGVEADVLALDDYHVMASPEWEAARPTRPVDNLDYPDWKRAGVSNFYRPKWFVQGPIDTCLRYLLAKSDGRGVGRRWRALNFERWLLTRHSLMRRTALWLIRWRTKRNVGLDNVPASAIMLQYFGSVAVKWGRRLGKVVPPVGGALSRFGDRSLRAGIIAENLPPASITDPYQRMLHRWSHPYFAEVLSRYDIVQCYGTYTAIPMMCGRRYLAYEHGTLRSLPFEETPEGELCRKSYLSADAVFVTNSDNLEPARQLGLAEERTIALPHAVDSDRIVRFATDHAPHAPGRLVRFFTATRQHWVDADPGWAKGNDRLLRALAQVRATGRSCVVRAIAWGKDLEASKQLASNLGVADMVEWVPVMPKHRLWREYLDSDAVLDQFVVPAIGGVAFEAMLIGRRLITRVDKAQMREFFGASPPVYDCESIEDIANAMIRVIDDPSDLAEDGARNQIWARQYHGKRQIVGKQLSIYRQVLEQRGDGANPPPRWKSQTWIPGAIRAPLRPLARRMVNARANRGTAAQLVVGGAAQQPPRAGLIARGKRYAKRKMKGAFIRSADIALSAAVPLGRWSTRRRINAGKARSLWGVTPILTLPLLARCDEMLGLRSRSLVYVTYHISKNFHINLSKFYNRLASDARIHRAFTRFALSYALIRYDFFSFFYDRGLLNPPNGRIWFAPEELEFLKQSGKRLYTYAYGADVRVRDTTLALGKFNFCKDCPTPRRFCICDTEEASRNIEGIRPYANAMVAMADMIHFVPGCRNFHYWPLDIDRISYVGTDWKGDRPLQVLHAPNHSHFKGSSYLIEAVERLQAENYAIELRRISGLSNAEVLQAMAEADIIAEQFIGGAFGYTAAEAWAVGKPVLTYARDPSVAPSWDDFPAINTNPDTLYETLKGILENKHDLTEIGRAGRRYAERHYSIEGVALHLGEMYVETGELSPKLARRVQDNIRKIRTALDQRLRRPLTPKFAALVTN